MSTQPTAINASERTRWLFLIVLAFFFISGACGLLYQVVWTRKLVLLFGTTSYAVSTVLSIFFLGLGLGSLWGGKLADTHKFPMRLYGIFEIIVGIWAVLFIVFLGAGESLVVEILKIVGPSYSLGIVLRGIMATLFLLLPVTLMGATLPLLARFVTAYGPVQGLRIGGLYSLNTFGAVAGCLITGFVLLENFGYTQTTLIGAGLNIGVGVLALLLSALVEGKESVTPAPEAPPSAAQKASAKQWATIKRIVIGAVILLGGLELYELTFGVEEVRIFVVVFIVAVYALSKLLIGKKDSAAQEVTVSSRMALMVMVAFALSGFCSLALEVMWMRLLTVLFLGTTYAFTTMLTSVLCGIALGSSYASLIIDRVRDRVVAYGFIQTLTGAACILMLLIFPHLPDMLSQAQADTGLKWNLMAIRKFIISFSVLFVPTFLLGMSFPFAIRIVASSPLNLGTSIGRVYSANTFGGVLGSLAGGYLLIPLLGTHNGIVAVSAVLAISGILLMGGSAHSSNLRKGVLAGICAVCLGGGVVYLPSDVSLNMNEWFMPGDQRIVDYREGVEGTVMVTAPVSGKEGTDRVLWINAVQATASIEKGVKMNRFQGILPFFFNRPMDQALFICFGSGVTAGTLSLSPFEQIDAVEISSDVLGMAQHFSTDNFDVLNNPRINAIIDDGRNYLLTTEKRYDLITFEPMPLALSGVSTFYTQEYYEQCLAHLTDEGIVSQWIPLHNGLSIEVVQSLTKTFTEVFPEVSVWFINADLFLIGSKTSQSVSYTGLENALAQTPILKEGLEHVYLPNVPELLATFFMNKEEAEAFAGEAEVMRDDLPWAEFLAPKMIYSGNVPEVLEALEPYRRSPLTLLADESSSDWPEKKAAVALRHQAHLHDFSGLKQYYGGVSSESPEDYFRDSLQIDPLDSNATYYLSEILIQKSGYYAQSEDKQAEVMRMLLEARSIAPFRVDVHKALGDAYYMSNDLNKARISYLEHIRLGGVDPLAHERTQNSAPAQ